MSGIISGVWRGYLRLLQRYPLPTMATTTGALMATGDSISQLVVERKGLREYSPIRSGRFMILGFFVVGPMIRFWYLGLDHLYSGTKYAAFKMVATDQLLMSPTFLCVFFSGMGILRGESIQEIKGKIKRDFFPVLMNNYKVWPLAQFINFQFVPLQHRVMFVNFLALFWNVYLSWVSERK